MNIDRNGWRLSNSPEYRDVRDQLLTEIDKALFGKQSAGDALRNGEVLWKEGIAKLTR